MIRGVSNTSIHLSYIYNIRNNLAELYGIQVMIFDKINPIESIDSSRSIHLSILVLCEQQRKC